jgi:hypothetical protein
MLDAALAVGMAIAVMHYLRVTHPPGGATALTAVIGGPQVHEFGCGFVITPVLVNALLMVVAAVAINAAFTWRRYPVLLVSKTASSAQSADEDAMSHADFVEALKRIGTFVDISEAEFLSLRNMMREGAARRRLKPGDVRFGGYYSDGSDGAEFCVRRILDEETNAPDGRVIWRVVAGLNRGCARPSQAAPLSRHSVQR